MNFVMFTILVLGVVQILFGDPARIGARSHVNATSNREVGEGRMQMEKTNPVTIEALVKLAADLKAKGRTSVTFAEAAKFIGCHHPSVRNFLTGSLSKKNLAVLSAALQVPVSIAKAPTGQMVTLVAA